MKKQTQPRIEQKKAIQEQKKEPDMSAGSVTNALLNAQKAELLKERGRIIASWREADAKRKASAEDLLKVLESIDEKVQAERIVIVDEVNRLKTLANRTSEEEEVLAQLTSELAATKPTGLPKKFADLTKQVEDQRKRYESMFPSNWSKYFVKDGTEWRSLNCGVLMQCARLRRKKLPGTTVEQTIANVAAAFIGDEAHLFSLRKDYYRTDVSLPSNVEAIADVMVALMTKRSRGT